MNLFSMKRNNIQFVHIKFPFNPYQYRDQCEDTEISCINFAWLLLNPLIYSDDQRARIYILLKFTRLMSDWEN